jgi:hypothetical protein
MIAFLKVNFKDFLERLVDAVPEFKRRQLGFSVFSFSDSSQIDSFGLVEFLLAVNKCQTLLGLAEAVLQEDHRP